MQFDRKIIITLCLGVILLLVTGSAMAGTTSVATKLKYAKELVAANQTYRIPDNGLSGVGAIKRSMSVIRSAGQNFFIDVVLQNGATFSAPSGTTAIPAGAVGFITVDDGVGGTGVVSLPAKVAVGDTSARFLVTITSGFTAFETIKINLGGVYIKDVTNALSTGYIQVGVYTFDSATGAAIDTGNEISNWFNANTYGVAIGDLTVGSATIDLSADKLKFEGNTLSDHSSRLGIYGSGGDDGKVLGKDGNLYILTSTSSIDVIISSADLTGIKNIVWASGAGTAITHPLTSAEIAAGTFTITVPGGDLTLDGTPQTIEFLVDGKTALNNRAINVAVNVNLSGQDAGGTSFATTPRSLQSSTRLTVWRYNGTVLMSLYANGNNAAWNSRFYIWNPSATDGNITVRLFTLPVAGGTHTQVGNAVVVGIVPSGGGINVRLAEDILQYAGVTLPYTANGGNLVVEFTIEAKDCQGWSQTFGNGSYMGIVNMIVPTIS